MQISGHFKNTLIAIGFGLVAAAIGVLVVLGFFMPAGFFVKNVDVENQNQEFLKTSLGIKAYGKLEIFEFLDKSLPSVAAVYKKKAAGGIEKFYLERDRLGFGFVLTSDGWIVTNKFVIGGLDPSGIAMSVKGKIYGPAKKVVLDGATDVAFIKFEASDLPVASIGNSDALNLGDIVFAGRNKNNFWFSYVDALNYYPDAISKNDILVSSEKFGKSLKLQSVLPEDLNGSMVANRYGEVVGIVVAKAKENYILPARQFKDTISDVLKNQKITRPYFGVNYIDLSYAVAEQPPSAKGAYIFGSASERPVISGSPAAKAGILTGDVILRVDDDELSGQDNLSEILSEYKPGDKINLKVLRAGKEMDVPVILGGK
jgi:S1-C subfamily serine protease